MLCLIDWFLAAMLTRVDLFPFLFASCGEYCGNGMKQAVSMHFGCFELLRAAMLTRTDLFSFLFESCGKYCENGIEQEVSV